MLSAYIVRKSEGKYQEAAEAARGFVKAKVLRIDRPLAGGFNVPPLAGGKVVHSTKGGRLWWRFAAVFIGCFAAVVGALKYGWAPLTIEPENRSLFP